MFRSSIRGWTDWRITSRCLLARFSRRHQWGERRSACCKGTHRGVSNYGWRSDRDQLERLAPIAGNPLGNEPQEWIWTLGGEKRQYGGPQAIEQAR